MEGGEFGREELAGHVAPRPFFPTPRKLMRFSVRLVVRSENITVASGITRRADVISAFHAAV